VENAGNLTADATDAIGIQASGAGYAHIHNAGYASVTGQLDGTGILADVGGDAFVENTGDIVVRGLDRHATGVQVMSTYGDVELVNAAWINAFSYYDAIGVMAAGMQASVDNLGALYAYGGAGIAVGVRAIGMDGTRVSLADGSLLSAYAGGKYAYVVMALSGLGGVLVELEDGALVGIGAAGDGKGVGVLAATDSGEARVEVGGDLAVNAATTGIGILGTTNSGMVALYSAGGIDIHAAGGDAIGMIGEAQQPGGEVVIANDGSIVLVADTAGTTGIQATSYDGDVMVGNGGSIQADAAGTAIGIRAMAGGDGGAVIDNSGSLEVSAPLVAIGIIGQGTSTA